MAHCCFQWVWLCLLYKYTKLQFLFYFQIWKRTKGQCPAWMDSENVFLLIAKIVFRHFLFQISLKFPTDLPVDVVLEADSVRRGTIDWQLQNKAWMEKKVLVYQTQLFSIQSFLCSCSRERRPTDDGSSQQGNTKGDSQWDGLNAALFRGAAAAVRHSGEHILQANKRLKNSKRTASQMTSIQQSESGLHCNVILVFGSDTGNSLKHDARACSNGSLTEQKNVEINKKA